MRLLHGNMSFRTVSTDPLEVQPRNSVGFDLEFPDDHRLAPLICRSNDRLGTAATPRTGEPQMSRILTRLLVILLPVAGLAVGIPTSAQAATTSTTFVTMTSETG